MCASRVHSPQNYRKTLYVWQNKYCINFEKKNAHKVKSIRKRRKLNLSYTNKEKNVKGNWGTFTAIAKIMGLVANKCDIRYDLQLRFQCQKKFHNIKNTRNCFKFAC